MVKALRNNPICSFVEDELSVFAFFFIPFLKVSPVASGVIVLSSIISIIAYFLNGQNRRRPNINLVSLSILLFMIYTIVSSLFVVQESKSFVRLVFEIRLPMLLLSLAFFLRGPIPFHPKRALVYFAMGACASVIVTLIVFVHSLFTAFDNLSYSFINVQLCFKSVMSLISHRTYIFFNLITALIIFYFLYSEKWSKKRVVFFISFTAFVAFLVFLSDARISLLTFLWVLLFMASREMKRYWGWGKSILVIFLVIGALCFILLKSPRVNNILLSLYLGAGDWKELDPRFSIWSCGLDLYLGSFHPLIGTGAGSAADMLLAEYNRVGFDQAIESRWEMHNQFLEVLLENGAIGLLLFISVLILPIFLRSRLRLFYLIWIPALCLNLFFECMLSRSIGTYPIVSVLLLSGIVDEKELKCASPLLRRIFLILSAIVVLAVSVKYILLDKRDAYGGFQRGFERVDNLPGNLPDEIDGSYGLKIDSTTISDTWREWAVMYYCLDQRQLKENDSISFSVYFYASEDFNADRLSIRIEERQKNSREEFYDLGKKQVWQKLEISGKGMRGNTLFLVSCKKNNSRDFADMSGFAIFARPVITIH